MGFVAKCGVYEVVTEELIPQERALDCSLGAVELAQKILGMVLVREDGAVRRSGIILETEAYPGGSDRASHSHDNRKTARNASMFLAGNHLYVYMIYGMHHCLNIVSGSEGSGEAVLIRSLEPLDGIDEMRKCRTTDSLRDLCRGPGRLAQAMGINREHDGLGLGRPKSLRLVSMDRGTALGPIFRGPRIGVEYAGEWAKKPYRFLVGPQRLWSHPLKLKSSKALVQRGR